MEDADNSDVHTTHKRLGQCKCIVDWPGFATKMNNKVEAMQMQGAKEPGRAVTTAVKLEKGLSIMSAFATALRRLPPSILVYCSERLPILTGLIALTSPCITSRTTLVATCKSRRCA